jgi:calcineurin-like phosphoesterase family protein
MSNVFLISDTHFGHSNICRFTRDDGSPLRPWDDVNLMDADMVARWNKVVGSKDIVYHLGDVVINRRCLQTLSLLNGDKRLILGNHDIFDHSDYLKYFKRLHGSLKLGDLLLSHIPLHPDSVPHWAKANVHGHIHAQDIADSRYFNVSVEMINYSPISLDELLIKIKNKQSLYSIDADNKCNIVTQDTTETEANK